MTPYDEPVADAIAAGIKDLLDEKAACDEQRDACDARIKQINIERAGFDTRSKQINVQLQKARGMIDGRTLGVPKPRKPRAAAASDNPEPPEAA